MFKQTRNPFEGKVKTLPTIETRPIQYQTPPMLERPTTKEYIYSKPPVPYIRKERNTSTSWIWVPIVCFLGMAGYYLFTKHKDKIMEFLERFRGEEETEE